MSIWGLVCGAVIIVFLLVVSLMRAADAGDRQLAVSQDFLLWQQQIDADDAAMRDVRAHFERLDEEFGR